VKWTDYDGVEWEFIDEPYFSRVMRTFETQLDDMCYFMEKFPEITDPNRCPRHLLPWLASNFGVTWNEDLPEKYARAEIVNAQEIYKYKGTELGVKKLVEVVTGWGCRVREMMYSVTHFNRYETQQGGLSQGAVKVGAYELADGGLAYGVYPTHGLVNGEIVRTSWGSYPPIGDSHSLLITKTIPTYPYPEPATQFLFNHKLPAHNGTLRGIPYAIVNETPPEAVDGFTRVFTTAYVYQPNTLIVKLNNVVEPSANIRQLEGGKSYAINHFPAAGVSVTHDYDQCMSRRSEWSTEELFDDDLAHIVQDGGKYNRNGVWILCYAPENDKLATYGDLTLLEAKRAKLERILPSYIGNGMSVYLDIQVTLEHVAEMTVPTTWNRTKMTV